MPTEASPARLTLDIERTEKGAIVRCHGALVYGVGNILYNNVHPLIAGSKHIVLDLTDLSYMDSMGLGTLVRLYVSAKSSGCRLELVNIGQRIRHLLELTNMWEVFATVGEHNVKF
jgi:anti-sigma B factor antagonist